MTGNNHLQFQLQQQNPPEVPPQRVALDSDPIPLEVRKLRVANGSRRQRDLAAVRMAEELERLERQRPVDVAAVAPVFDRLQAAVPESTFRIWLEPLEAVGEDGSTLLLTAPDGVRTWVERRYSPLIREALQGTGYSEVEFVDVAGGVS